MAPLEALSVCLLAATLVAGQAVLQSTFAKVFLVNVCPAREQVLNRP